MLERETVRMPPIQPPPNRLVVVPLSIAVVFGSMGGLVCAYNQCAEREGVRNIIIQSRLWKWSFTSVSQTTLSRNHQRRESVYTMETPPWILWVLCGLYMDIRIYVTSEVWMFVLAKCVRRHVTAWRCASDKLDRVVNMGLALFRVFRTPWAMPHIL